MKDCGFKKLDFLIALVEAENSRQIRKWGIQDHDPMEWACILTEEIGELARELLEVKYRDSNSRVIKEAIQAATLCLKIAEMHMEAE